MMVFQRNRNVRQTPAPVRPMSRSLSSRNTIANVRLDKRRTLAMQQAEEADPSQAENSDLRLRINRPGGPRLTAVFNKCFEQNDLGEVKASVYQKLENAVQNPTQMKFDQVDIDPNSVRKLEDPQGTWDYSLAGGDAFHIPMRAPAGMQTAETAGEMVEVYGMALLRDESFADLAAGTTGSEAIVTDLIADLNAVGSDFLGPKNAAGEVDRSTLFRGPTPGETVGPYVSQFLLHDFNYGNLRVEQKVDIEADSTDSVTIAGWLDIQRGITPGGNNRTGSFQRISNVRALGSYVHNDPTFQAGWNAALILLTNGASLDSNLPSFTNRTNFMSLGGADLLNRIGHVAELALKAAWRQKWLHLRLRPEAFAGRVHYQIMDGEPYGLDPLITGSSTVGHVLAANTPTEATYLLSLQYPEGSPTHPAFPAGHAVLAGAVATLLKAWFNGTTLMKDLSGGNFKIIESLTGAETYAALLAAPITDPAVVNTLTVNAELNKLASNIATARNMAGVHYRSDGDQGTLLGEKVAIQYLKDVGGLLFSKPFAGFTLEKFDGTTITIVPNEC
jgi:membrane-associated phospholipid phosphatase